MGERQRVEILKALYRKARILILDEPTAVLTPQESRTLFKTLRQLLEEGLSIIFISHKLAEVLEVSDRIAVLRDGKLVMEVEVSKASENMLAEAMVGRSFKMPIRKEVPAGESLLDFDKVSVLGPHRLPVLEQVSFSVHAREVVGLAGISGNGQRGVGGSHQWPAISNFRSGFPLRTTPQTVPSEGDAQAGSGKNP